jgi:hypothetical protein
MCGPSVDYLQRPNTALRNAGFKVALGLCHPVGDVGKADDGLLRM